MPHSASRTWLVAIAAGGLVWGQYHVHATPESSSATAIFCLAAIAAAVIAARRGRSETIWASTRNNGFSLGHLASVAGGAALVVAGALLLYFQWQHRFYVGWGLVGLGTAVSSAALRWGDGRQQEPIPWSRYEIVGLLLALGLGALLRFYQYDTFPGPFTTHAIEEQQTGLAATRILEDGAHPWEFFLDYHVTALALGLTDTPTFNTIRLPFTLASWLTIVAAHLLLRQLFATPAAVAGTLLFAFSSWNLLYSRCAHPIFFSNLVVVAIFALLVHFGRTRRLASLPWIGLLTASTLYSYAGYRATLLFVVAFVCGHLLTDLRRTQTAESRLMLRRNLAALVLILVWVGLLAIPILGQLGRAGLENYYLEAAHRSLANQQYYTADVGAFVQQRADRIRDVARLFLHEGDGSLTFNRPLTPMVDPLTGIFFVPGLLLALLRPRRAYAGFFVFVFVTLLAGGTVFVQNLDVRRLQGITILVTVFAAHFIDHLVLPRQLWRRRVCSIVAIAVGAAVVAWSFRLYHVDMAGDPAVKRAFRDHYTTLIQYGQEHRPQRVELLSIIHRFFDPSYHYRANYAWLIDPVLQGTDMADLHDAFTSRPSAAATLIFQEPLEPETAAAVVRQVFPGTRCHAQKLFEAPDLALVACQLPLSPQQRTVEFGLQGRYWFGERNGAPDLERSEPFLGYAIVPRFCTTPQHDQFCTAEWNGSFEVTGDTAYTIRLEWIGRTEFEASLDGTPLGERAIPIRAGRHNVSVRARLPRSEETGVRLVLQGNGVAQPVRFFSESLAVEGMD